MNIGINLLAISPGRSGGIEVYVRNLIAALAFIDTENQYYLYTNLDNDHIFVNTSPNFHKVKINIRTLPKIRRVLYEQFYLPYLAKKFHLAVLHSPSYTWPLVCSVPGVLTICDMLYKTYPEYIGRTKLIFWKLLVPISARKCRLVITISENSKRDIVRFLNISPEKVLVTPLGLDSNLKSFQIPSEDKIKSVCDKYGISKPYILCVGGVGRHKNAVALLKALVLLRRRAATKLLNLVITGNDYGAREEIESSAKSLNIRDYVSLPGYVDHGDLPLLYAGAEVYASTSYFEGFGLTLLEAMANRTPVVTSNRSSLPEVVGDAASIVDPDDVDQLVEAIYLLFIDVHHRNKMIERGSLRVKEFSWNKTAILTLAGYQKVLIDS